MDRARIGVVGVGNISGIYLQNLGAYPETEVVAVADLDEERARKVASERGIPRALSVEALINDPDIDVVLNLTIPKAHADVSLRAVQAGKHVYVEKPLGVNRDEARKVLEEAEARGLRVGCAPDTFLGGGIQTCRQLIDEGAIGEPVAANAFMLSRGHETWHPSPEFYYEVGGGPMLDMGPYYVTALLALLGPVRRVTGSARASYPTRTITSQPKHGKVIPVETATHLVGIFDFESGPIAQITQSFDVHWSPLAPITVYGSEGTLLVPDPNTFGGEVWLRRGNDEDFKSIPLTRGHTENERGLGLRDMVRGIRENRPHRASGRLAYHALDAMLAVTDSSDAGRHIELESRADRPQPLSADDL